MSPRQRRRDREGDASDPSDPAAVADALRAWADDRRREQLDRALGRLDARGGASERERAVLADLSRSLTASLLDPPLRAVEGDDRAAAVAADLFELEGG